MPKSSRRLTDQGLTSNLEQHPEPKLPVAHSKLTQRALALLPPSQVKELTSQGDYQLRLRDLQTEAKLKTLTDVAAAQAAAAKARHDALDKARTATCCSNVPCYAGYVEKFV